MQISHSIKITRHRVLEALIVTRCLHTLMISKRLGHFLRTSGGSVRAKQLVFANGPGRQGGRPMSTWRDGVAAVLRPMLTPWLAGRGGYNVSHDHTE
eukprot:365542-Chlamydomonas_euryale.AAC.28